MRTRAAAARASLVAPLLLVASLLLVATPAAAHRLDEYLEATTIAVWKDRVEVQLRLAPGVAVLPTVLAGVDANADGVLSGAEQRAYAERVLRDLSLRVDGDRLRLRLVSTTYPSIVELQAGRGEILIALEAAVPRGRASRQLTFENRHQSRIAAYLVNGLVPRDPDIRIAAQSRNYEQSFYRMDYLQAGAGPDSTSPGWWLATAALLQAALLPAVWRLALRRRRVVPAA
jgi:hypothetical protein